MTTTNTMTSSSSSIPVDRSRSAARARRAALAGAALTLLGTLGLLGLSGCGQTSYFDVSVTIKQDPKIGAPQLARIDSCYVTVSGAATDSFPLNGCSQGTVTGLNLGTFQYGTDKDSGSFTFSVVVRDGVQTTVGTGSVTALLKSGTRTVTSVEVALDPTKFM